MHLLVAIVFGLLLAACASIGRPEGGPRDVDPPYYVSSNPAMGALNSDKTRLDIVFNENIALEDAFNKVVVSPVQKQTPQVSSNGRHVTVTLRDTLIPNTTYTIDFADAVKDLNEGNILDGFAMDFSTGDSIDTLRISGMVVQAMNLEPAQSYYVGIYSNLSDTAITTLPFERIARTNQLGQFTIRNLKPGNYRIYALNDLNRDYKWDRSEDVAFYDVTVSPSVEYFTVTDTLLDTQRADSLVQRPGIRYLPNNILLSWFNEDYKSQYLKDYARPERNRITLNFAAPGTDSLPEITIADGKMQGRDIREWALTDVNPTRDSLVYWIKDKDVIATDSLRLSIKYLRTDTTDCLSWTTDTLRFFYREPKQKKKKEEKPKVENDSVPPVPEIVYMDFKAVKSGELDVYSPLYFEAEHPIATIDTLGYRLEFERDSVWTEIPITLETDSINPLRRRVIDYKWEPGTKYRFTVDSAAITGIYDFYNKELKHEFSVKKLEDYSNLTFNIQGVDSAAVVQLLNKSDEPAYQAEVVNGKAVFKYLNPGTYYARIFLDDNKNGKWDTGNLLDSIQPEEVYYYPKKIDCKKNWDIEQSWNIYELPIDKQKPYAILKNKPKLKRGEQAPRDTDEDEEDEDGFGANQFGNNNRNSRNSNNNGSFNNLGGGFKTNNRF
jgi:uncharacterized protein (DUF2141 family)